MALAHKLALQLRAAEDRIAQLEAEVALFRERAIRAEGWLQTIHSEIEQKLTAPRQPPIPNTCWPYQPYRTPMRNKVSLPLPRTPKSVAFSCCSATALISFRSDPRSVGFDELGGLPNPASAQFRRPPVVERCQEKRGKTECQ
jgi:hypothetical protein